MVGTMPLLKSSYRDLLTLPKSERPIIDHAEFGRIFKALRVRRGYRRMPDLSEALEREFGIRMSSQGLYMYEQGRSLPPLETFIALVILLKAPGGVSHFYDALPSDIREGLQRLR
jgi:transcriptional regulator with XRE-family HTH domain